MAYRLLRGLRTVGSARGGSEPDRDNVQSLAARPVLEGVAKGIVVWSSRGGFKQSDKLPARPIAWDSVHISGGSGHSPRLKNEKTLHCEFRAREGNIQCPDREIDGRSGERKDRHEIS